MMPDLQIKFVDQKILLNLLKMDEWERSSYPLLTLITREKMFLPPEHYNFEKAEPELLVEILPDLHNFFETS
jgi:hypothetical protein